MNELFVYRHKTDKNVYLMRKYEVVGGSTASHFYRVTTDFKVAVRNVLADEDGSFERHLETPYMWNDDSVPDTLPLQVKKEFDVDGYKGVGTKEILYHLKDFEKVWFVEKGSSKKR